jgi:hypothetical protein
MEMDFGYRLGYISHRVGARVIPVPYMYTLFIATFLMVIHLMITVDSENAVEATWKHVKFSLCVYNRSVHYVYYLVEYMFGALCRTLCLDPFIVFTHSISSLTGCSAMCSVNNFLS